MDTIYPEPLSRLHRRVVPKKRRGQTSRYRTQPVTFSEIQEVDEDNLEEAGIESSVATSSKSELDINRKFEEFMRSREKAIAEQVDENSNPRAASGAVSAAAAAAAACKGTCQSSRFTCRPSI